MQESHDDHLAEHPDERFVVDIDLPELRRTLDPHERVRRQERVEIDPPRLHVATSPRGERVRDMRP